MPFGICPANSLGLLPTPHSFLLGPEGALDTLASQLSSEKGYGEALKGDLRFTLQEIGPAPPETLFIPSHVAGFMAVTLYQVHLANLLEI